jgi:hypothetical protein
VSTHVTSHHITEYGEGNRNGDTEHVDGTGGDPVGEGGVWDGMVWEYVEMECGE